MPREATADAAERAAVEQAAHAWTDAYNTRDPVRIVAFYEPDAVFWGTGMKVIATTGDALAQDDDFKDLAGVGVADFDGLCVHYRAASRAAKSKSRNGVALGSRNWTCRCDLMRRACGVT